MATLKSVLHHFNKALKEYDTLHPETEVAQIVDLLPTINAAINGSSVTWDGKKFTNNALGITGLIDTNGYVAFGPNFGGLIIQWGLIDLNQSKWTYNFPIAFASKVLSCCANDCGDAAYSLGFNAVSKSNFTVYWNNTKNSSHVVFFWLAVGQ